MSGDTAWNTLWIYPSAIGPLTDDEDHHIAFSEDGNELFFCSRPRRLSGEFSFKAVTERLRRKLQPRAASRSDSDDRFANTLDTMIRIINAKRELSPSVERLRNSDLWKQLPPRAPTSIIRTCVLQPSFVSRLQTD